MTPSEEEVLNWLAERNLMPSPELISHVTNQPDGITILEKSITSIARPLLFLGLSDLVEEPILHHQPKQSPVVSNAPPVIIKDQIEKLSKSESRVFINGPTGSGKELISRKIYKNSKRNKGPFVVINGALLDAKKYEFELFGEEKNDGSIFYGALEKASGGVLLIDEVTEIPLETQTKILRVVIDQKFKRINSNHDIKVDVRIICSSSKDMNNEIKNGNFREDLYHRLNVFNIKIDPLCKRIEDIPLLIDYFIENICKTYNYKKFTINDNNYLLNYDWPGNIRELRNLIERIAILSPGEDNEKIMNIIKESLSKSIEEDFSVTDTLTVPLKEARESFEKKYLISQLKKFSGNISKTAKFIGMERSALHRKLKLLGVKDLN